MIQLQKQFYNWALPYTTAQYFSQLFLYMYKNVLSRIYLHLVILLVIIHLFISLVKRVQYRPSSSV